MNLLEDERHLQTLLQKHQSKTVTSVNDKDLKMAMVKDLIRVHYNAIDKEIWLSL